MQTKNLSAYLDKLINPSEIFYKFLHDYVTGSIWIRSRGEEDITVWKNLKGEELRIAKQIIMDRLKIAPDSSYINAVGIFRDSKAIPILESIINMPSDKFWVEKLRSAKVLFDWIGYDHYLNMLELACKDRNGINHSYMKYYGDFF